jgi:hypothetical protein
MRWRPHRVDRANVVATAVVQEVKKRDDYQVMPNEAHRRAQWKDQECWCLEDGNTEGGGHKTQTHGRDDS